MNFIVNPVNGRKVSIYSKLGKQILKNIKFSLNGGMMAQAQAQGITHPNRLYRYTYDNDNNTDIYTRVPDQQNLIERPIIPFKI